MRTSPNKIQAPSNPCVKQLMDTIGPLTAAAIVREHRISQDSLAEGIADTLNAIASRSQQDAKATSMIMAEARAQLVDLLHTLAFSPAPGSSFPASESNFRTVTLHMPWGSPEGDPDIAFEDLILLADHYRKNGYARSRLNVAGSKYDPQPIDAVAKRVAPLPKSEDTES